ncbi:MAG TPA: putative metal-binding motif-containing protein, partial [Candidatus Nanoarchaeia archaeon]|nr:putative metal-binding motif-containing protein [Candidatus Nanoarchaeia archaeon]
FRDGNPLEARVYSSSGVLERVIPFGVDNGGSPHYPLIGDIDADNKDEIIIYDPSGGDWQQSNSLLYAFNGDGTLVAGFPVALDRDYHPTLLMADIDQDSVQEIIVKGNDAWPEKKIVIVSARGKIINKWTWWIGQDSSWAASTVSSPAVGNFDNDPELEIVVAGLTPEAGYEWETNSYTNEGIIYVYNSDGTVVEGWPAIVPGVIFSSPIVADLSSDVVDGSDENNNPSNTPEIVVGLMYATDNFPDENYGGLYAFDSKGNILPGWPIHKGWNFWSTPSLGDVDQDGDLEIAASRLGFFTYLVHHDGTSVTGWENGQLTAWNDYYSTEIVDVNGDSALDIVSTAGGIYSLVAENSPSGGVYAWDADGHLIDGFPKVTEVDAQAPAVAADLDKDATLELIAASDFDLDVSTGDYKYRGSLYVWEVGQDTKKQSWSMFMHDPQHTGLYSECMDADQDSFSSTGGSCGPRDCNDNNKDINPNSAELCDNADNNCDGNVDEGLTKLFYGDKDKDGYGFALDVVQACTAPLGYVAPSNDCNDDVAGINPGSAEICDNIDNNCNAQTDENVKLSFYVDADRDGYGAGAALLACTSLPGYVQSAGDCRDYDAYFNPGRVEVCDNQDNNCNGNIDEGPQCGPQSFAATKIINGRTYAINYDGTSWNQFCIEKGMRYSRIEGVNRWNRQVAQYNPNRGRWIIRSVRWPGTTSPSRIYCTQ